MVVAVNSIAAEQENITYATVKAAVQLLNCDVVHS